MMNNCRASFVLATLIIRVTHVFHVVQGEYATKSYASYQHGTDGINTAIGGVRDDAYASYIACWLHLA